jgi:hypothetical protein
MVVTLHKINNMRLYDIGGNLFQFYGAHYI